MLSRFKHHQSSTVSIPALLLGVEAPLILSGLDEEEALSIDGAVITFALPKGRSRYLSTTGRSAFDQIPGEGRIRLMPGVRYRLVVKCDRPQGLATMWVIEYSKTGRLVHQTLRLREGGGEQTWQTHAEHECCLLALRLEGEGRIDIRHVELSLQTNDAPSAFTPSALASMDIRGEGMVTVGHDGSRMGMSGSLGPDEIRTVLDRSESSLVILLTGGVEPGRGDFDRYHAVALDYPGRFFNVLSFPIEESGLPPTSSNYLCFCIEQLEVLWQTGRLHGLELDPRDNDIVLRELLQWAARRQVLTIWSRSDPPDMSRIRALMVDVPPLAMAKNVDFKLEMIWPDSSSDTGGTCGAGSDVSLSGWCEHMRQTRERVLADRAALLFPSVPQKAEEVDAQGFQITTPDELPEAEHESAKTYWSEYDIKSWYQQDKPWAQMITNLVRTLKPRSVLEFGCNVGRNLQAIHQALPDVQLVGLDVNEKAVRLGRDRTGLDLRVGDESTLRQFQEGEFDLVFTVSVLDHIVEVQPACEALAHCAARHLYCLEVTLPVEGKVTRHFDHAQGEIRSSTEASYSWHLEERLGGLTRVKRLDARPCYLHSASLGPYYWSYLAHLESPDA